jgi:hypothetical protein
MEHKVELKVSRAPILRQGTHREVPDLGPLQGEEGLGFRWEGTRKLFLTCGAAREIELMPHLQFRDLPSGGRVLARWESDGKVEVIYQPPSPRLLATALRVEDLDCESGEVRLTVEGEFTDGVRKLTVSFEFGDWVIAERIDLADSDRQKFFALAESARMWHVLGFPVRGMILP